jgi:hypothetical protein
VSTDNVTPYVGYYGSATGVPGTDDNFITDAAIDAIGSGASANRNAFVRLHSVTVSVQCGAGSVDSKGFFYLGAMPGNIFRTQYATFGALADAVVARREAKQKSAYQALESAVICYTAPQDVVQWSSNAALFGASATKTENVMTDTFFPVGIVWESTAAALAYSVIINCEWRVVFSMGDARSSLHEPHALTPPTVIGAAQRVITNTAGTSERTETGALHVTGSSAATSGSLGINRRRVIYS